ncbi:hypothetical protein NCCP2050_29000 [Planococcus sp. NCCP-2050]|nr:hypothetical protein NCCP2050_29000 [Planococcus sp. NCCP-2050]
MDLMENGKMIDKSIKYQKGIFRITCFYLLIGKLEKSSFILKRHSVSAKRLNYDEMKAFIYNFDFLSFKMSKETTVLEYPGRVFNIQRVIIDLRRNWDGDKD